MVIERGRPWGEPLDRPPDLPSAASDTDAAALATSGHSLISLHGGDLLATLGGRRPEGAESHGFPIDLGWVRLDGGEPMPFVAHVVARGVAWGGPGAVVMNAAWFGPLYLGPRAHPNDGLLDITVGHLAVGQRVLARPRARAGTHLPHPTLSEVRRGHWRHQFDRPVRVFVDGVKVGRARELAVELVADAFTVVI